MATELKTRGKWTLNPRGNLWMNDENKFGHKLLTKMGWSKGKGLGKNENGIAENLKVKVKNNHKGVGWNDKSHVDVHHDEYNALLSSLNNEYSDQNGSTSIWKEDETNCKVSLENRSKTLKNRLHYQKFIRGKDVSKYSKKDMQSIFGQKVDDDSKPSFETDMNSQLTKAASSESKDTNKLDFDMVPTLESPMSIPDYFAQKMKKKSEKLMVKEKLLDSGKLSNSSKEEHIQLLENDNSTENQSTDVEPSSINKKKRKKSSKNKKSKKFKGNDAVTHLKSCLKLNSAKYKIENQKKEVSFSENVSYRNIESRQEQNMTDNDINEDEDEADDSISINKLNLEVDMPDNSCQEDEHNMQHETDSISISKSNLETDLSGKSKPEANMSDKSCQEDQCNMQMVLEKYFKKTSTTNKINGSSVNDKLTKSLPVPRTNISKPTNNSWIESQKQALKMRMYKNMHKEICNHLVLGSTNLTEIKGYGNW